MDKRVDPGPVGGMTRLGESGLPLLVEEHQPADPDPDGGGMDPDDPGRRPLRPPADRKQLPVSDRLID